MLQNCHILTLKFKEYCNTPRKECHYISEIIMCNCRVMYYVGIHENQLEEINVMKTVNIYSYVCTQIIISLFVLSIKTASELAQENQEPIESCNSHMRSNDLYESLNLIPDRFKTLEAELIHERSRSMI